MQNAIFVKLRITFLMLNPDRSRSSVCGALLNEKAEKASSFAFRTIGFPAKLAGELPAMGILLRSFDRSV